MGLIGSGQRFRRAVQWISDERQAHPDKSVVTLVSEAGMRFDLSPKDQEGLQSLLKHGDEAVKTALKADQG